MKPGENLPQNLEDRKVQKLLKRIEESLALAANPATQKRMDAPAQKRAHGVSQERPRFGS